MLKTTTAEEALKNTECVEELIVKMCMALGRPSSIFKEDPKLFDWLATGNYPLAELDSDEEALILADLMAEIIDDCKRSKINMFKITKENMFKIITEI